jgi:hypothetical protein
MPRRFTRPFAAPEAPPAASPLSRRTRTDILLAPPNLPTMPSLRRHIVVHALVVLAGHAWSPFPAAAQSPLAVVDTALARMGGVAAAQSVKRVRFEMLTQWQRITFDERPYGDQPVYEMHSDLRDYDARSWRNTRRYDNGRTVTEFADVVNDSVAIRRSPGGPGNVASPATVPAGTWTTLNVAYADERRELFAFAPERALLGARAAGDLRMLRDTLVAGSMQARVAATVEGFPMTLFVSRSTGFLTAVRFAAAEPNDFGLVPWGRMDVEVWFSGWRKQPGSPAYPSQWDVRRVGRPYKRMTVLAATFNPAASPDSFVVSDSLRGAYLATAMRPMHDVPLDSARVIEGRFASFNTPGAPAGAVKLGREWVLLESGQAPSSAERAAGWLSKTDGGARVSAALVTAPSGNNGGVVWLTAHHVPVYAPPAARPYLEHVLRGHGAPMAGVSTVARGQWLRVAGDSLWIESVDLPDLPGALVVYSPSLQWLYSASTANPLHLDRVLALARSRGWMITRTGSARAPITPLQSASR